MNQFIAFISSPEAYKPLSVIELAYTLRDGVKIFEDELFRVLADRSQSQYYYLQTLESDLKNVADYCRSISFKSCDSLTTDAYFSIINDIWSKELVSIEDVLTLSEEHPHWSIFQYKFDQINELADYFRGFVKQNYPNLERLSNIPGGTIMQIKELIKIVKAQILFDAAEQAQTILDEQMVTISSHNFTSALPIKITVEQLAYLFGYLYEHIFDNNKVSKRACFRHLATIYKKDNGEPIRFNSLWNKSKPGHPVSIEALNGIKSITESLYDKVTAELPLD